MARLVKSASRVPRKDESLVRIRQRALKTVGSRQKHQIASVVKRRSCGASNAAFRVRILAEACETVGGKQIRISVPVVEWRPCERAKLEFQVRFLAGAMRKWAVGSRRWAVKK